MLHFTEWLDNKEVATTITTTITYFALPPFCWGVELPTEFSKRRGGLTGPQFLKGVCWERGE